MGDVVLIKNDGQMRTIFGHKEILVVTIPTSILPPKPLK